MQVHTIVLVRWRAVLFLVILSYMTTKLATIASLPSLDISQPRGFILEIIQYQKLKRLIFAHSFTDLTLLFLNSLLQFCDYVLRRGHILLDLFFSAAK